MTSVRQRGDHVRLALSAAERRKNGGSGCGFFRPSGARIKFLRCVANPGLTGVLPNALRSPLPSAWTFCDPCRGRLSLRFCSGGGAPKALATGYPLARLPACSLCERAVIETRNPRVGQQALTHWATEIPPLRGYRPTLGVRRPAPTTHRYARLLGDWREGLVVDR